MLQDKKDAVKFARGDRAEVNKMKPTEGFAAWRIKSMSATGKAAIEAAGKYHDELLAVHKERVQEALDEGKDVPAEVLADYPDLAKPDNSVKPEAGGMQFSRTTTGTPTLIIQHNLTEENLLHADRMGGIRSRLWQ